MTLSPKSTLPAAGMLGLVLTFASVSLLPSSALAMGTNGGGLLNVHLNEITPYEYPEQAPINDPGLIVTFADFGGGAGCGDLSGDCRLYDLQYPDCTYGSDLDPDLQLPDISSFGDIYKILWVSAVFPDSTCVELKKIELQITSFNPDSLMLLDFGAPPGATYSATPNWPNEGGAVTITFDSPLTNHVSPVCWIAIIPLGTGTVEFGISKFYYDETGFIASSSDTPIASIGGIGYNPTFSEDCPITRACCLDGVCDLMSAAECAQDQGIWSADETLCDPNPCETWAVCCLPDGSCEVLTLANCDEATGSWLADFSSCDQIECQTPAPLRACCQRDGSCDLLTMTDCSMHLGIWHGDREICDIEPCPQPAPCCLPDGSCEVMIEILCSYQGGLSYQDLSTCTGLECAQPKAACCLGQGMVNQGGCLLVDEDECQVVGGEWLESSPSCDGNPCRLRACCVRNLEGIYICVSGLMRSDECQDAGGLWTDNFDTCDPNPCLPGGPETATKGVSWGKLKSLYQGN